MRENVPNSTARIRAALAALSAGCALFVGDVSVWAAEGLRVQSFKSHGRLEIGIDEGVPVQWNNSSTGFTLLLKGVALTDLGAPMGEERQWQERFRNPKVPHLKSLAVSESAAGVRIEGKWKFPTGADAPAEPQMEIFEFRDKEPRYVVDFWPKKGPTVREVQAAKAQARKLAEIKQARALSERRAERKVANEKKRSESENVANFCSEPLSDKTDVFLPFYAYHEKVDFSRWIPTHTPDETYTYERPLGKEKEAQYVRLALDLYAQGKYALVLRTLDFHEAEFPSGQHLNPMRFLRANALIKLGLPQQADPLLARLLVDAKDSQEAVYASMYKAGRLFESGSALAALESFLWLINHYPNHRLTWVFHMGAAEALFLLKQTERATKEYQWVVENGPSDYAKAQAALRVGDLYLERFQYEQALAAYYQALSHFPTQAKDFPAVFVNRGETLYQLGQFERAEEIFKTFLAAYPAHPSGWRAAFRLGEIQARQPSVASQESARKWFYETVNRYPTSPGATLARLRLIPCGDHGGFDLKALEVFMAGDAEKFDGRGEVSIKRYRDYRALAWVRGLVTMDKEDLAVTLAMDELRNNPSTESKPFLRKIIGSLFRRSILKQLAEGKKYEALTFYQDRKDMITREIPVFQLDYLLKLSQAASELGLGTLARQLVAQYEKAQKSEEYREGRSIASAEEFAIDPEAEERASERAFTKARALWASRAGTRAEIRGALGEVSERSRWYFEREIMLGLLDEEENKLGSALAHAAKAQILKPAAASDREDLSLEAWLASLQSRVGDPRIALEMYVNIEKHLGSVKNAARTPASATKTPGTARKLGVPAFEAGTDSARETVWLAQGALLESMKRWGEAAAVYGKLVEKGWGGDRAAYSWARNLMKTGQAKSIEKGRAALRKLASAPQEGGSPAEKNSDGFWKRLASETLANDSAKEGGK